MATVKTNVGCNVNDNPVLANMIELSNGSVVYQLNFGSGAPPLVLESNVSCSLNSQPLLADLVELSNGSTAYQLKLNNTGGTGPLIGTPPTIVQSAADTTGSNTVTFGSPPTNGNLLVAMAFNPHQFVAGAGWALRYSDNTGVDYGTIYTKTAGVDESATQTPLFGNPGGTGAIVIWEINGQAVNYWIEGVVGLDQAGFNAYSVTLPIVTNGLILGACGLVPDGSNTIIDLQNLTQDRLLNTNSRYVASGHATLATATAGVFVTRFPAPVQATPTPHSKSAICLITA